MESEKKQLVQCPIYAFIPEIEKQLQQLVVLMRWLFLLIHAHVPLMKLMIFKRGLLVHSGNLLCPNILIGARGGIASLLKLAQSMAKDVHESAAEALWVLSFRPINAILIARCGGLGFVANCCTLSMSKMVQFVSALTLTYIFDGSVDEYFLARASSIDDLKSRIDAFRFLAMKSIDDFIFAYSEPPLLSSTATSSSPALLTQVAESAHILEAGHLRCSGAEIERLTVMLRNSSNELKTCAAFALLQFTYPGNQNALHHASLLNNTRARAAVRAAAVAASAPVQSKIFAKIVLRNLEHHQEKTLR